jgi:hypothetical protein
MKFVTEHAHESGCKQAAMRTASSLAWVICIFVVASFTGTAQAAARTPFRFESLVDLSGMRQFIEQTFQPGSPREALRTVFVADGKATLKIHPSQAGVEKYIYDINLCRYYIWRWNVSADYDATGHLIQAYVNGDPVFAGGGQKKDGQALGASGHAGIFKLVRSRPEADLGEKELAFRVIDGDGDLIRLGCNQRDRPLSR